jgi:hypothetical protein
MAATAAATAGPAAAAPLTLHRLSTMVHVAVH